MSNATPPHEATTQPLWSDNRIAMRVAVVKYPAKMRPDESVVVDEEAKFAMAQMRDDYEHALYDLRHDVAVREKHVAKLEAEVEQLRQQLADSVPRSEVNAMIDNNRVSDAVTIQSLQHELAEREAWEPVPDGIYELATEEPSILHVEDKGYGFQFITQAFPGWDEVSMYHLTDEYRLCRRRTQGGNE